MLSPSRLPSNSLEYSCSDTYCERGPPPTGEAAAALPAYALRHGMVGFLPHVLPALTACEEIAGSISPQALGGELSHVRDDLQRLVHDHALTVLRDNTADWFASDA